MAATTATLSSRVTFRAAPVRGAKAVSSKAARAAPLRNVTTRASIADLPKENKDCKVLVVGGTGYIGKFVVRELCAQGYDVTAFVDVHPGGRSALLRMRTPPNARSAMESVGHSKRAYALLDSYRIG